MPALGHGEMLQPGCAGKHDTEEVADKLLSENRCNELARKPGDGDIFRGSDGLLDVRCVGGIVGTPASCILGVLEGGLDFGIGESVQTVGSGVSNLDEAVDKFGS